MKTSQLFITRVVAPVAACGLVVGGGVLAVTTSAAASSANITVQSSSVTTHWTRTAGVTLRKLAPARPNARAAAAEGRAIAVTNRSLSPHPSATSPDMAAGFAPPSVTPTPVISPRPASSAAGKASTPTR